MHLNRRLAIGYGFFGFLLLAGIAALLYATQTSGVATQDAPGADGTRPSEGVPAPDFSLQELRGGTVTLSRLRGQPVLLFFWATW